MTGRRSLRRRRTTKSRKPEERWNAGGELMSDTGQTLREARERKQVTIAQAAEATRIKSTHLEQMERNRFDGFAAPIYARGFIRSYAEYLGLDPQPLLEDYQRRSAPAATPVVQIPSKIFRSSAPLPALAAEEFPVELEPELPESEPVPRAAPAPKLPAGELDLFSTPAPEPTLAAIPAPPPAASNPPPAMPTIPAPPPDAPPQPPRPERTEPESVPAPSSEFEEAKSFKPLIYGAIAALLIGLVLYRCANRKAPAAAPKPEAEAILIEPPPEPFFPVRRAPPAAQPAP